MLGAIPELSAFPDWINEPAQWKGKVRNLALSMVVQWGNSACRFTTPFAPPSQSTTRWKWHHPFHGHAESSHSLHTCIHVALQCLESCTVVWKEGTESFCWEQKTAEYFFPFNKHSFRFFNFVYYCLAYLDLHEQEQD